MEKVMIRATVRIGGRHNAAQRAAVIAELTACGALAARPAGRLIAFERPARSSAAADIYLTAHVWAAIVRDVAAAHGLWVKEYEAGPI